MADDIQDPVVQTPANGNAGGGSSSIPDPRDAELAELRAYAQQAQATFERLKPYEEDLQPFLEDEGYREFQRTARKSYYQTLEEQKKQQDADVPAAEKRLLEEFDKRLDRFKPVLDDYDARAQAQTRAQKEASEKFQRENMEYAQRLVAEQKLSQEEVLDLGRFAKALHEETVQRGEPRYVPLEEAYKRLYGRAESKNAEATPRSLRAKSAAPGIPGASKPTDEKRPDMKRPGDFTNYMLDKLNRAKGA
jgi:DNA repair exonuclease SbcCD ATPase subunit